MLLLPLEGCCPLAAVQRPRSHWPDGRFGCWFPLTTETGAAEFTGSPPICFRQLDLAGLVRLDPSPIIAPNRAIAVAELEGSEVALAAVDRIEDTLASYHAYHATRAGLLRRLGGSQKSRAAYDKAIGLAGNTAQTACLARRDQLG